MFKYITFYSSLCLSYFKLFIFSCVINSVLFARAVCFETELNEQNMNFLSEHEPDIRSFKAVRRFLSFTNVQRLGHHIRS